MPQRSRSRQGKDRGTRCRASHAPLACEDSQFALRARRSMRCQPGCSPGMACPTKFFPQRWHVVARLCAKRELLRLREKRSMATNPFLGASSHMPRHANHSGAGRAVENPLWYAT